MLPAGPAKLSSVTARDLDQGPHDAQMDDHGSTTSQKPVPHPAARCPQGHPAGPEWTFPGAVIGYVPTTGGTNGGVSADEWRKLLPGVWFYDPAFMSTACAESAITYVDGDNGILEYRGYPIEQLAQKSTYLEVAYLLLYGELPTAEQAAKWNDEITYHTIIHENMRKRFLEGFHYNAHPMGILVSAIAALSTYYPEAQDVSDPAVRHRQIRRLIG